MYRYNIKKLNTSGFTLVELLVVMAIFGIILAGVLKVFDTSNYTYKVQEEVTEMQQNVRVTKMFIEKDVRMAGCDLKSFRVSEIEVYPFYFQDNVGANGSDKLIVTYIDHSVEDCADAPPDLRITDTMPDDASAVDVKEEFDNAPYDKWESSFTCGDPPVTYGSGVPFIPFQIIVREKDGSRSDVVWVTNVMNNGSGTWDKILNNDYPSGISNKIINHYPEDSTLSYFSPKKLRRYAYYVVNDTLKRDTLNSTNVVVGSDIVATNIEDLQIAFNLDTDNDGEVDTWIGDTGPAVLTDAQSKQVRLVRITILGKTASEHRGYTNTRPGIENNAAGAATDGYRRKQLQVTIKVRNLGLS